MVFKGLRPSAHPISILYYTLSIILNSPFDFGLVFINMDGSLSCFLIESMLTLEQFFCFSSASSAFASPQPMLFVLFFAIFLHVF